MIGPLPTSLPDHVMDVSGGGTHAPAKDDGA